MKRKQRNKYQNQVMRGKLALVDLAGSERASETNSGGQKLRDGANINRSLLALANCINALGKQQKKGLAYVPYRNRYLGLTFFSKQSGGSFVFSKPIWWCLVYPRISSVPPCFVANVHFLQQIDTYTKRRSEW